jgi:probable phosphoglycerate mutase
MADETTTPSEESNGQVVAYAVRHGRTVANEENKFRGQLDIPLDENGKQDAKDAAEFLADKPIGQAWTSPLSRSKDTAKVILKGRGIKAIPDDGLLPLDSGKLSGKSKEKYRAKMDYYEAHPDETIPGGESLDDIHERARRPLLKALRAGLRSKIPSLISAHASILHVLGELLHGDHEWALTEPGGIVEIVFDGKKFHAKPVFKAKEETKETQYAS